MKNGRPPKDRTGDKPNTRICNKCKQSLPLESFSKDLSRHDKLKVSCKECSNQTRKQWSKANPQKDNERQIRWAKANPERVNARNRRQKRKDRKALIDHYGGKCECCGENRIEFLAIDHIDGGGTSHRLEVGKGERFYSWLRRNGFPEGFRVLCHNCNLAIGFYGYCPHSLPSYNENTYIEGEILSPIRKFYIKQAIQNKQEE